MIISIARWVRKHEEITPYFTNRFCCFYDLVFLNFFVVGIDALCQCALESRLILRWYVGFVSWNAEKKNCVWIHFWDYSRNFCMSIECGTSARGIDIFKDNFSIFSARTIRVNAIEFGFAADYVDFSLNGIVITFCWHLIAWRCNRLYVRLRKRWNEKPIFHCKAECVLVCSCMITDCKCEYWLFYWINHKYWFCKWV